MAVSSTPTSSDFQKLFEDGYLPVAFISSPGKSNCYMVYSHGNACDLGEMMPDLIDYAEYFQVGSYSLGKFKRLFVI